MKRSHLAVLGIAIAALLIGISIFFYLRTGVTKPVEDFLNALRQQDYEQAYTYTSHQFQQTTPLATFKKTLTTFPAFTNTEIPTLATKKTDDQDEVLAILKTKNGSSLPVAFGMVREAGYWKIFSMQITAPIAQETAPIISNTKLPNLFEEKNNRYSIRYPAHWTVTRPNKGAVVFRGEKESIEYNYTIDIETIFGKKLGGEFTTVDEFVQDLKKQYTSQTKNVQFLEEKPITINTIDGKKFSGISLIFTYSYQKYTLKQWQIIIMRSDDSIFYLWAFTAPINLFANHLDLAKMVLDSWVIY